MADPSVADPVERSRPADLTGSGPDPLEPCPSEGEPLRVLVVCTANVCRSPVAERLLDRHLRRQGVSASVRSAGTRGGLLAVHPDTVVAARPAGIELTDHRSRRLELGTLEGADLVVTMTREHLREVVAMDVGAWRRTFTLKELARRVMDTPRSIVDLAGFIADASAGRKAADLMTSSTRDDLPDPYGRPLDEHLAMVAEIDALTSVVAAALARVCGDAR